MNIILQTLIQYLIEIKDLFLDMAPYIMLGTTIAGLMHVFISKDFVARHAGSGKWSSVLKASLFGVPLPLCSCGVIPTATYLKKSGASRPAVISFLISTPQTGIDSMIATYGMMGPFMAVFRPFAAFAAGIIGGTVSFFTGERIKTDKNPSKPQKRSVINTETKGFIPRLKKMTSYAYLDFIEDISINFIIGLAVAAAISLIIPEDFFAGTAFAKGLPGMLLMIAVGIPMYICSTSSIPIALTLMMKGISPGAAFVFLMAGPATNAASLAMISKVLGKKQTAIFLLSIIGTSLLGGLALDGIINLTGFDLASTIPAHHHNGGTVISWFTLAVSLVFLVLLLYALFTKVKGRIIGKNSHNHDNENNGEKIIKITGMTCNHCAQTAKNAICSVSGIETAEVDINTKTAVVKGDYDTKEVYKAIENAGYGVKRS